MKRRSSESCSSDGVRRMVVQMPYHNKTTKGKHAIGLKTKHLIEAEGKTPEQAYAMANAMSRAGRLTSEGGYVPVKKGKRGRRGR